MMESNTLDLPVGTGGQIDAAVPAAVQPPFRGQALSTDGFCLTEQAIRRLDRSTFRKLWLIAAWGPELRTFAQWGERGEYLADVITGSLYNDDGTSPTGSPLRLSANRPSFSRRLPTKVQRG